MGVVVHSNGEVQVNGRWLNIDSEVSITGERGRFRYLGHSITSENKIVLNFIGGNGSHHLLRSFYPDRIKTVHNKREKRA
jgi:muramoyltetrapeptide carboxypeptidase LdcA involved in peptidoglycan recycling